MLKPLKPKILRAGTARFAIVASRYNSRYVDAMLRAAQAELKRAGAKEIQIIRVPGAFEIPLVAARLAGLSLHASRITHHVSPHASRLTPHSFPSAIICL